MTVRAETLVEAERSEAGLELAFAGKLRACIERNNSLLCIGLDPELDSLPDGYSRDPVGVTAFNRTVINATQDLVCAYKPNLAFYEALGSDGLRALEDTLAFIPSHIPTVGDAKRGDIPNSARMYARALFGTWGFDSVTVNPYLGMDSLMPFLDWQDKGVWMLCHTSNPGAGDLQELGCEGEPLYASALRLFMAAPAQATKGVVVGATSRLDLQRVRELAPEMPLLIPGIGAQGGDARAAVEASGTGLVVVNASRSILYASGDGYGSVEGTVPHKIRAAAVRARDALNVYR